MADELELQEVEILESKIRLLESKNQDLLQENERLISTVAHLEATKSDLNSSNHLLLQENERLRSIVSDLHKAKSELAEELETLKIDFRDREKSLELEILFSRTRLDDLAGNQTAIDKKSEQIERLLSEIKELKWNYDQERRELRQVVRKKAELAKENGRLENKIDRITEDNTVVILSLLTAQSDLETDLKKQTEIIRNFFQGALLMVRKTVEMLEGGGEEEMNGGDVAEGSDQWTYSTVEMLLRSLEVELMGVKKAFWRRIARNKCSSHPNAAGLWNKPFPHYDDLATVFGKDRAMGEGAKQAGESVDALDKEQQGVEVQRTDDIDLELADGLDASDATASVSHASTRLGARPSKQASRKRARNNDPLMEKLVDTMNRLGNLYEGANDNIAKLATCFQFESDGADRRMKLFDEIMKIEGLDDLERLKAGEILSASSHKIDYFFTLPGPFKRQYVAKILDDDN